MRTSPALRQRWPCLLGLHAMPQAVASSRVIEGPTAFLYIQRVPAGRSGRSRGVLAERSQIHGTNIHRRKAICPTECRCILIRSSSKPSYQTNGRLTPVGVHAERQHEPDRGCGFISAYGTIKDVRSVGKQNRLLLVDQCPRRFASSAPLAEIKTRSIGLVFFDLVRWHRSLCTKNKPGVSLPFS